MFRTVVPLTAGLLLMPGCSWLGLGSDRAGGAEPVPVESAERERQVATSSDKRSWATKMPDLRINSRVVEAERGTSSTVTAQAGSADGCDGMNQSPVDLGSAIGADLEPLLFRYTLTGQRIVNTGTLLKVEQKSGSTLWLDGENFDLQEYHFHAPAEHAYNDARQPLAAHLVHRSRSGSLAVVAVFYEQGPRNEQLDVLLSQLPTRVGVAEPLQAGRFSEKLLPDNKAYYRYSGSLTVPPCREGVIWIVMKQPLTASAEQLRAFVNLAGGEALRPLQPLNGRLVLE